MVKQTNAANGTVSTGKHQQKSLEDVLATSDPKPYFSGAMALKQFYKSKDSGANLDPNKIGSNLYMPLAAITESTDDPQLKEHSKLLLEQAQQSLKEGKMDHKGLDLLADTLSHALSGYSQKVRAAFSDNEYKAASAIILLDKDTFPGMYMDLLNDPSGRKADNLAGFLGDVRGAISRRDVSGLINYFDILAPRLEEAYLAKGLSSEEAKERITLIAALYRKFIGRISERSKLQILQTVSGSLGRQFAIDAGNVDMARVRDTISRASPEDALTLVAYSTKLQRDVPGMSMPEYDSDF